MDCYTRCYVSINLPLIVNLAHIVDKVDSYG